MWRYFGGILLDVRLFVAIWPPSEVLDQLEPVLQRLQSGIGRQGVRFTKPEKMHLTLRFLGDVDEKGLSALIDALAEKLQGLSIGEVAVSGLGGFPDEKRPAIVWAGLKGEFTAVHEKIIEATEGFEEGAESKPLRPHLTLARVSPPSQKVGRALEPVAQEAGDAVLAVWTPNEVVLVQTMPGGGYEQMASFPLVEAPPRALDSRPVESPEDVSP